MNISKSLDYLHCLSFGTLGNEISIYDPITRRCSCQDKSEILELGGNAGRP